MLPTGVSQHVQTTGGFRCWLMGHFQERLLNSKHSCCKFTTGGCDMYGMILPWLGTWYSFCIVVTVASIIQFYPGPFWLLWFSPPAQLPYCAACSKLQNHVYIICRKIKIGNYIWKKRFWVFRFSLLAISSKMQMHKDPFFSNHLFSTYVQSTI